MLCRLLPGIQCRTKAGFGEPAGGGAAAGNVSVVVGEVTSARYDMVSKDALGQKICAHISAQF